MTTACTSREKHEVTRIAVAAGVRAGAALGVCVVVLAVIGLTPSMSWVPELPLVGVAILLPLFVFGLTGFRAGQRTQGIMGGLLAGALAGVISGGVGGLSYVIFGKSLANIAVGMLLGALAGAAVGAVGAAIGIARGGGGVER
jgi:hypothetical protein